MEINTHACDICKTLKKEINHWYKGVTLSSIATPEMIGLSVYSWDADLPQLATITHLCGIECAMKWVGRRLSNDTPTA